MEDRSQWSKIVHDAAKPRTAEEGKTSSAGASAMARVLPVSDIHYALHDMS